MPGTRYQPSRFVLARNTRAHPLEDGDALPFERLEDVDNAPNVILVPVRQQDRIQPLTPHLAHYILACGGEQATARDGSLAS